MSKRMLVNATQPEELRVAMVDGQRLFDLDIEIPGREQKKGNIYKARIIRYEPSLEALFVLYLPPKKLGENSPFSAPERQGFLPLRGVAHDLFAASGVDELTRANIKDILPEGREILVQVDKEERGNKGAALTTFISLAGFYLVLMPNNPRAGGISRRVEGNERAELRDVLSALDVPEGMGIIIRTAGVGRSLEELQWDLSALLAQWKSIQQAASQCHAPTLIHQEGNVVIRAVRDYLRPDVDKILVDDPEVYQTIYSYIRTVRADFLNRIELYQDPIPLFNRYQIESQIESAFRRTVQLPSGGVLVIDHTEALVAIDVNSAKATRGGDIEETALHTNLEAVEEIARQLRLRDLAGIIVIDLIDMMSIPNQRMVEARLREAVEMDRARIQIGRISRFGLLELSRQRLRPVLGASSRIPCPRCEGQGSIRSTDSQALIVLRVLEEEAIKDNTAEVLAELPIDVATYLMNEKRNALVHIESHHQVKIIVIPNPEFNAPHYRVNRIRTDDIANRLSDPNSYTLITKAESKTPDSLATRQQSTIAVEPAVKVLPNVPRAPTPQKTSEEPGLIKRLWGSLFGSEETEKTTPPPETPAQPAARAQANRRPGGWNRNRSSTPSAPQKHRPIHAQQRPRSLRDAGQAAPLAQPNIASIHVPSESQLPQPPVLQLQAEHTPVQTTGTARPHHSRLHPTRHRRRHPTQHRRSSMRFQSPNTSSMKTESSIEQDRAVIIVPMPPADE